MTKTIVTFKPKQAVKELIGVLPVRAQDVLKRRYGLGVYTEKETLEAIGGVYDITRERVRQIENFALSAIRRSPSFDRLEPIFLELKEIMEEYGVLVNEKDFLEHISTDVSYQNHIHFLLVLGDYFERLREDDDFHHRWTSNKAVAEKVHKSLRALYDGFTPDELVVESQVVMRFLKHLEKELKEVKDEKTARRWLALSKTIDKNPLGEWGVAASPNIKARGIRDLAYLVLRNHGSPMHFTEVAHTIEKKFDRSAHEATVHNELIKDKRFVLVGRGLYALTEWGYERGVVRDIIKAILKREGPLTKKDIIDKVLKERHVKENTIVVNLQNSRYFKKDKNGNYTPLP